MTQPLSESCCNTPVVVAEGYELKGEYKTLEGLKTYVTGSATAERAILFVYDIFGFANQTLQGADILAAQANALVFLPDFLQGGLSKDLMPFTSPEGKKAISDFFSPGGNGEFPTVIGKILSFAAYIKANYPSVKKLGSLGLCIGGKYIILASGQPTSVIDASAQGHPARLTTDDLKTLKVPHLVLASKDEDANDVKAFDAAEKPEGSETYTYPNMIHGWMGARGDLTVEENSKEFARAYQQVADWTVKVLGKSSAVL